MDPRLKECVTVVYMFLGAGCIIVGSDHAALGDKLRGYMEMIFGALVVRGARRTSLLVEMMREPKGETLRFLILQDPRILEMQNKRALRKLFP